MNGRTISRENGTIWVFLLWAAAHVTLCGLVLVNASAAVSIVALTVYALCALCLDGLLYKGGSRTHIRFLRVYWLLACACMLLWLFLAEPLLAGSCDDVLSFLLLNMIIPYALNLSGAWGSWASSVLGSGAGGLRQWLILLFCAGQAVYYLRLSKGGKDGGLVEL